MARASLDHPRDLHVIAHDWLDHQGFYRYEDRRRSTEEVHAMAKAYLAQREALSQIAETARWYANNGNRLPHEVDHALCVEVLSVAEGALHG